ncbi:MAG: sialate O-acetylesterase [Kiritimatiellales bacterium]
MKMKIVAMLVLAMNVAAQAAEPLDVYICAGQSNMQGARTEKGLLPAELQAVQENVFVFNDKTGWEKLAAREKGFGPEISFAYEMQKALNKPVGIIKHAKGGTNLAKDWDPSDPNSLYSQLKQKVDAAGKTREIRIAGMIWMQGENDSRYEEMAKAYAQNLTNFIQTARKDFNSPGMPFVAGRVNPPAAYAFAGWVRKAQETCAAVPYSFVDCDDLPKHDDNLHYNTGGQVELGKRFAQSMKNLK